MAVCVIRLAISFLKDLAAFDAGGLDGGDAPPDLGDAVGVERNRIDAGLDQELGEFRIVARRLATDPDLAAGRVGGGDDLTDHFLDGRIPFVEQVGQVARIAVHAQDELGEVVAADREAVEAGGEFAREQDVRRDLAHHVDLKAVLAALQAVGGHFGEHPVGLLQGAAEGDHGHDVAQPDLVDCS